MQDGTLVSSNYRVVAVAGYALIVLCFGGIGVWASVAQLDGGVVAVARVSLESHRKVVQHLEGGTIKQINAKEGQLVHEGDVLFRLDDTQTSANLELVSNDLDEMLAREARLLAERNSEDDVTFPDEITARKSDPTTARIIADQMAQFRERRSSLDGQVAILKSRIVNLQNEIEGLNREGAADKVQLFFIDDELPGVRELLSRGLAPKDRRNTLERERARLDGLIGRNEIEVSKARNSINEIQLQVDDLQHKRQEEVGTALQDTRQKLSDLRDKLRIAADAQRRNDLLAPRSGMVQNLKVTTVGQVLHGGDLLLEIVPLDDELIVEAQVQPIDIDSLHEGMDAEVRFSAFHSRTTPVILGKNRSTSHDRLTDDANHTSYFLAQVAIADTDLPSEFRGRLRAGMEAEVIFPTGERTVMEYLLHPLKEAMLHSFKER